MQYQDGKLLYSPSDLVNYTRSPFISWMDRWATESPDIKKLKDVPDAMLAHLASKGYEHEAAFLDVLRAQYRTITVIDVDNTTKDAQVQATLAAMHAGADVIFQARLSHEGFAGYADFLVKVDTPSKLGRYAYEPWDTKLAKSPKAYFIIQLCCYAEMLQAIQGTLPQTLTIVLGTQEKAQYRTLDFYAYYQRVKRDFLAHQNDFTHTNPPDPFAYTDAGDWSGYVEKLREERDHLSKIANITRNQINKLNDLGIATCSELIADTRALLPKLNVQVYQRLKQQATVQQQSEKSGTLAYKLLPAAPGDERLGFRALPPHSNNDLFFDLEGFPFIDDGLEYLWGVTYFDDKGERQFWERWAHDHEQEKQALIDFVMFAYARWQHDKTMHIYHYGHYEISVLKRLMGRYGVMESRIDDMLRAGVFVDLYQVVRHAILIGAPSYSIKKVERLYRPARQTDVASGDESVVMYANWRATPDGATWQQSEALNFIRSYNIDDCDSTQELVEWLREAQQQSGIAYQPIDLSAVKTTTPEEDTEIPPHTVVEHQLRAIAADPINIADDRLIATLLADLMDFYQREDKPTWWRFFERQEMSFDELYDDADCLVDCYRVESEKSGKQTLYEYQYDVNQEFRNKRFKQAFVIGANGQRVTIDSVDSEKGRVRLKARFALPENITLISYEAFPKHTLEASLWACAKRFTEKREIRPALKTFLLRKPPRISDHILTNIDKARDQRKLEFIQEAVDAMNGTFLSIQGPPGTGKTYTASHVIYNLLKAGKRIGVSSNSHAAINNLLKAVARLTVDNQTPLPIFKIDKDGTDEMYAIYPIEQVESKSYDPFSLSTKGLVGFTAWGAQNVMTELDYLFVDEAGQVSIANLIAMAHVAENIVVMGDQMQLPQPVQGTHPGDSGMSVLDYLLKDMRTIPAEQGIFLNCTYRMHQNVNAFISTMIYEGRLENHPDCDNQKILYPDESTLPQTGIAPIALKHTHNKQYSAEEVNKVTELVQQFLTCKFQQKDGTERAVTAHDILVVAPFNHQVNELKKAISFNARVGTVDMFQGQEAPIVIVSMTASQAIESPRGADFLLNINRLNVAISRAQALAVVVHAESLLDGTPNKIEDIQRFNIMTTLLDRHDKETR